MEEESTSIRIKRNTLERLRTFEIHHRETHDEIIQRLMDKAEGKEDERR